MFNLSSFWTVITGKILTGIQDNVFVSPLRARSVFTKDNYVHKIPIGL